MQGVAGEYHKGVACPQQLHELVSALHSRGVRVVAFDMDHTITTVHSRSQLHRGEQLQHFISSASHDFALIVGALVEAGIELAVATHSDARDYRGHVQPATHVLGEELVQMLLDATVPDHAAAFKVVAYNPQSHRDQRSENRHKRRHIREIAEHYMVPQHSVLLVDDDPRNVWSAKGAFPAVQVDERSGVQCQALLLALEEIMPLAAAA